MNQAQFAEHLGITQQRVAKLTQRGIFTTVVKFKRGSRDGYEYDPVQGKKDFDNNRSHVNRPKKKAKRKPKAKAAKKKVVKKKSEPTEIERQAMAQAIIDQAGLKVFKTLTEAQTFKETYLGALRKIEYDKESGKSLDAEDVKRDAERVARIVKEKVTSWPGRTAPIITPLTDVFEVEQALKKECDQLLNEISKEVL